jgi:two-component system LytT family response regulator
LARQSSGQEAVQKIKSLSPDLVFLDIKCQTSMLRCTKCFKRRRNPFKGFTTTYDNYALRAYEENTVDYLLKPIETALESND